MHNDDTSNITHLQAAGHVNGLSPTTEQQQDRAISKPLQHRRVSAGEAVLAVLAAVKAASTAN